MVSKTRSSAASKTTAHSSWRELEEVKKKFDCQVLAWKEEEEGLFCEGSADDGEEAACDEESELSQL